MTLERVDVASFRDPPREHGILPFWFLNGALDPDEMRFQLHELRDKGMHGVVLHGRFGLEMPYVGERYLERIAFATEEAYKLGLVTWIYDEMNWPSGTADKRVPTQRPDLAERYVECLNFTITGPWFMYLTGGDSRYLDFEHSTPVAAFAIGEGGRVIDLTPNLSFDNVIPWEVPPGEWRLMYMVQKRADYYIDALNPEATREFLRVGYLPYAEAIGADFAARIEGFYSDEPAMHYFLSAGDNAIVPWTKGMFARFRERNGYDLRPRMPDLFYDVAPDTAKVRYDFYSTLTELYTQAYYAQIRRWCGEHGVRFTAHLLYEEWLRRMIRVEGNLFRHYENMDVVAVDHLYPVIGTRESPDQHVAIKVASSAAHHVGSERVICESFGGIFMDATMQRMKWIADWECVLGVNVVNPHGFHYTLEGARKRDWPPSMFYQYPWWPYYGEFSRYVSRLCAMLAGGTHVAQIAMLWPINAMFATYRPQEHDALGDRIERDFNILTDALLRLHRDFDFLDERILQEAEIRAEGTIGIRDEKYELLILPPLSHVELATVDRLERFLAAGGRVLAIGRLPSLAFDRTGLVAVTERMEDMFGPAAGASSHPLPVVRDHDGGGRTALLQLDALGDLDRAETISAVGSAIDALIDADIRIDDEDLFCLHRRKDGRDLFFVVNPTFEDRSALVSLPGECDPARWDPSTGEARSVVREPSADASTVFRLRLPATGSAFIVVPGGDDVQPPPGAERVEGSVELDGEWDFELLDDNALVLRSWRAQVEGAGELDAYVAADLADEDWLEVVNGAWALQVPGGPGDGFPMPVWFRIPFDVDAVPQRASLVIDGFAGEEHTVYMNGRAVGDDERRSAFDSQMKTVDIHGFLRRGRNVVAVRLMLRSATDGLVDLVKIVGDFALERGAEGYRIAEPHRRIRPEPWTGQGYPFLSGRGRYGRAVSLERVPSGRAVLEVPMTEDVLEVAVNGRSAGVRMWPPYSVDVTEFLRVGENMLELTVANTLANLLSGIERPSGLAAAPRLVTFLPMSLGATA